MDREQKFISVVAYVHNAENEIGYFLDHVMEEFRRLFVRTELILVNDGSTDGSLDRIHTYFDTHDEDYIVSIIRMGRYQGMESSMNAGRDLAIGDYVFEFDDLHVDYDLSVIENVYRSCLQGHDIVAASGNARMKATSRLFYHIYNQASRSQNNLGQETFRILSRRAINRVKSIGAYIPYRKAVYNN
ncbi:MAG: glycosyltransferase, partial [Eubacterium sp.]|nr:glycosyltransferase [Eubacterium sp.]